MGHFGWWVFSSVLLPKASLEPHRGPASRPVTPARPRAAPANRIAALSPTRTARAVLAKVNATERPVFPHQRYWSLYPLSNTFTHWSMMFAKLLLSCFKTISRCFSGGIFRILTISRHSFVNLSSLLLYEAYLKQFCFYCKIVVEMKLIVYCMWHFLQHFSSNHPYCFQNQFITVIVI